MSGGYWSYDNDRACHEIFGWSITPDYGDEGFGQADIARKIDPLGDKQLSELVWDVFCLLHSYDWCNSGDTGEDTYNKDVKYFKEKWIKASEHELIKREIDKSVAELKSGLYKTFDIT